MERKTNSPWYLIGGEGLARAGALPSVEPTIVYPLVNSGHLLFAARGGEGRGDLQLAGG